MSHYVILITTHIKAMSKPPLSYNGKILGEKTFANFEVLWLFEKVFSANFGACIHCGTSEHL